MIPDIVALGQKRNLAVAILTATVGQLERLTGIKPVNRRIDRSRGHAVAAFGVRQPLLDTRCLLLDGVAWLVRDELAKSMPRTAAANLTLLHWPEWTEAFARAEHRGDAVLFAAGEQVAGPWWCGSGPAEDLPGFIASQPPLRRLAITNIAQLLIDMRERAARHGFDLSTGSITLPPDDERWLEMAAEWRAWRAANLAALSNPSRLESRLPRPSERYIKLLEGLSCDTRPH
jgi:hypothetical protein